VTVACTCGFEHCRKTVSLDGLRDGRAALVLRRGDGALVNGMIIDRDGMEELHKRLGELLGKQVSA